MPNTNHNNRGTDNDGPGRRAYDSSTIIQPVIINQHSGDDKMAETSERVAVVETIAKRNEQSIERLIEENSTMKANNASLFAEVNQGLMLLKQTVEVQCRTQEAIAGRVDSVVTRVGALEVGLAHHKNEVDKGHQVLHVKIDGVDSSWRGEKARLLAWAGGITFVISGLWTVFGGTVKTFLGQ